MSAGRWPGGRNRTVGPWLLIRRAARVRSVDALGQPEAEDSARYVDQGACAQHPGRVGGPAEGQGEPYSQRRGDEPGQRGSRVRRHEGQLIRQQPRRDRAPRHRVDLLQDQHAERRREQRDRVMVQGRGHPPAQQAARQQGPGQDVAAALVDPVQHRADERRQHRERRHGNEQVDSHLTAGLVERGVEEQGPGERHRDERVADIAGRSARSGWRGRSGPLPKPGSCGARYARRRLRPQRWPARRTARRRRTTGRPPWPAPPCPALS